jgi:hypothetical protein
MLKLNKCFVAILISLCAVSSAFGWGGDGHRLVAYIATQRLTPEAAAAVKDLLGNATLVDVATWADDVRRDRKETGPWHYVDIPVDAPAFAEDRDGKKGENVIDRVEAFAYVLDDKTAPKDKRVEALKFIVHLCGDIHQPLHCADRKDKGGNMRLVFFLDEPRAKNLHSVWDTSILLHSMNGAKLSVYGASLNARIKPADVSAWENGDPEQWANESHKIAVEHTYLGVPADGPPPKLDQAYVDANAKIVDEQLEKAGVRLAMILNRTLGNE